MTAPSGHFAREPAGLSHTEAAALPLLVEPDLGGLDQLTGLVEAGKLRPEVPVVLPLADAAKAHELIESGRTRGKVVLSVH
ncbi:zinc-binding dehydrogenase [Streptomyces sp. NPDC056161]|uniref:zinc-binding dehydrogenase n=1 Tax=Streptomyces sp. NPDC056161 TaxID=3345732 RepID=UPI0035DBEBD9